MKKILRLSLIIFLLLLSFVEIIMMYLIFNRSSLEYNSEGNYYDSIDHVVYHDSNIIGYFLLL